MCYGDEYLMDFSVEYDVLRAAVSWVGGYVPARPTHPIMGGMTIVVDDTGAVTVGACDYVVSARESFPTVGNPGGSGKTLVPGAQLLTVVKALPPGGVVRARLDGNQLVVSTGSSRFRLPVMPYTDYPDVPVAPPVVGVIPGDVLREAARQVTPAASVEQSLPILTGAQLVVSPGGVGVLMATDRYRIAERSFTVEDPAEEVLGDGVKLLVPATWLRGVGRALSDGGDVEVGVSDDLVSFTAGGRVTVTSQVDGDYPNLARLFPDNPTVEVVVKLDDLLDTVKRLGKLCGPRQPLRFSITTGGMVVSPVVTEDATMVSGEETIPVTTAVGVEDNLVVGYNYKYLLDGLTAYTSEFVKFQLVEPHKPMILVGCDKAGEPDTSGFRYLVMPTRIHQ